MAGSAGVESSGTSGPGLASAIPLAWKPNKEADDAGPNAFAAAVVLIAAGCSANTELAVEISEKELTAVELSTIDAGCTDAGTPPCIGWSFTAAGEAVEEDVFCSEGSVWWLGNETPDGGPLPNEQIAAQVEAGEIFPIVTTHDYECADGSGAFGLKKTINFDPSIMEMSSGTWSIESGTGSLANLTGSGDIVPTGLTSSDMTGTVSSD